MVVSEREKQFVVIGSVVLALLGFYVLVFADVLDRHSSLSQQLPAKEEELYLLKTRVGQLEAKKKEKEHLLQVVADAKRQMIGADSPGQAAASLLEILKVYADAAGLAVDRQDSIKTEDVKPFPEVLVRFDVTGKTDAFRDFLYRMRTSPKLLGIRKMRISPSQDKKSLVVSLEVASLVCEPGADEGMDVLSLPAATPMPVAIVPVPFTPTPVLVDSPPATEPAPVSTPGSFPPPQGRPRPVPPVLPGPPRLPPGAPAPLSGTTSAPYIDLTPLPLPPGRKPDPGMNWDHPAFLPLRPDGRQRVKELQEMRRKNAQP